MIGILPIWDQETAKILQEEITEKIAENRGSLKEMLNNYSKTGYLASRDV